MKINKNQLEYTKIMFLFLLFTFAFGERILFDLGPNVELVTLAMVLSSFYVSQRESFWLIFVIIALSDIIIGNTNIFLFTWSGFLIPTLFTKGLINKLVSLKLPKIISLSSVGLFSNIFFFIWTNFGVWLLSGMYPKTLIGLLNSYINALPFFRNQIVGTLVFIPLGFFLTELILSVYKNLKVELNKIEVSKSNFKSI